MTQHIFNAAYFFSWCLSEFGGHMILKLTSVESVFGISGIIRYRPNLPWSVLVRDRVCVRVRFPWVCNQFSCQHQNKFLSLFKGSSYQRFLFLKSVSERDGSDIQQLWYWMTTLKYSVLIFCTVYNFWFFVNSHQKILNQLSGLEMIDSPKMNAEQKFREKIFSNRFN